MNKLTKALLSLPLLFATVAPSASAAVVIRSSQGYDYHFERENISVNVANHYTAGPSGYETQNQPTKVVVNTYGIVTDQTGTQHHFSGKETCIVNEYTLVKHETYYNYSIQYSPRPYEREILHLGWMTYEQRENLDLSQYNAAHVFHTEKKTVVVEDDTITRPAEYVNQNKIICMAAREYNLI